MKVNKFVFSIVILVIVMTALALILPANVHAQAQTIGPGGVIIAEVPSADAVPQFAEWQVWLIGAVASALVALINWLANAKQIKWQGKIYQFQGVHLGRFWLTIILLIIACGLGYWWFPFTFPPLPILTGMTISVGINAIFDYVSSLVKVALPYIGAAVGLYNLLLRYITDPSKRQELWQGIKDWVMLRLGIPENIGS